VADLDIEFLELANQEHAGHGIALECLLRRFLVARPLTRAKKVIDACLVISGKEILVGDGLAIDRAVLAQGGAGPRSSAAELDVRREEHNERNDDDRNDY